MTRSPLILFLIIVVAASQVIVDLWEYRDAPESVKAAVVLGGIGMAALGVMGLAMLRRR